MIIRPKTIIAIALTSLFLLMIILIKTIDVAPIGPEDTEIGFSTINKSIHDGIGIHLGWYKFTEVLGIIVILAAGLLATLGVLEWITRKSLWKVDSEILTAGILYCILLLLYVFFEKVVVNYRPVVMPGETEPEASFPSSHTMLAIGVMGSIVLILNKYIEDRLLLRSIQAGCIVVMLLVVIGRFVSGVHWFTDIFSGILLGAALLTWFSVGLPKMKRILKNIRKRKNHA